VCAWSRFKIAIYPSIYANFQCKQKVSFVCLFAPNSHVMASPKYTCAYIFQDHSFHRASAPPCTVLCCPFKLYCPLQYFVPSPSCQTPPNVLGSVHEIDKNNEIAQPDVILAAGPRIRLRVTQHQDQLDARC